MNNTPFFSIIVPTRNRDQELQTCLDSVFHQSYDNYEVLILDDGSEKEIRQQHQLLLQKYDARFQWHEINGIDSLGSGPSVIRNIGLEKAKGLYVAFCDDDDCWHREDHLAVAAQALENSQAESYFSGMKIMDEEGNVLIERQMELVSNIAEQLTSTSVEGVYSLNAAQMLAYPDYAHLNITIVKRDLIVELGGFWPHTRFAEDVDLFVRICDKAEGILFRPEICATHFSPEKRQTTSVSNQLSLMDKRLLEVSVYQHLLVTCESKPALDYAVKSLVTIEKLLTHELKSDNKMRAAVCMAGAAFFALPTLKWGGYTGWITVQNAIMKVLKKN